MKNLVLFTAIILCVALNSNAQKPGTSVGNKAPELIGTTPDGKNIKLSDTKGKLVLLDFWASWCGPCRRENPVVANAFRNYKNKKFTNGKGFTVFSVSLDRARQSWTTAIKQDKLDWPYHISDLKGWQSKHAAIYHVRSIPYNYLIDKNGIIVAKNLRGPSLEAALKHYLK